MNERTGEKQYELTNHLGNVQATVSDNKFAYGTKDSVLGWHPALRTAYDYYPFGMLMPGRHISNAGSIVSKFNPNLIDQVLKTKIIG